MATAKVNGVELAYDDSGGSGPPLVLVHGSWGDSTQWGLVVPALAETFRVVTYDRRGHSGSAAAPAGGTMRDDVEDLAALIGGLGLAPAHIVGSSYGAIVSLNFAATHPDLCLSLNVHEPPLGDLLRIEPADAEEHWFFWALLNRVRLHLELGHSEGGLKAFIDGFFPGTWHLWPEASRASLAGNGPTFLDEIRDRGSWLISPTEFGRIRSRTLLTIGSITHPFFVHVMRQVASALPQAGRFTFDGAGHGPQQSHLAEFVAKVREWALQARP